MFKRKQNNFNIPQFKTAYPDGLVLRTETGRFLIKGGKRYQFFSELCYSSWNLQEQTVIATDAAIAHIPLAGFLGFRDGTLLKNYADAKVYFISANKRRHVKNPYLPGIDQLKITMASDKETKLHEEGEPIE